MSRSYKKFPISGHSCKHSEKLDKIFSNRKFRKICKQLLKNNKNLLYKVNEVSDRWTFQKDGKRNWNNHRFFINYFVSEEFIKKQYRK